MVLQMQRPTAMYQANSKLVSFNHCLKIPSFKSSVKEKMVIFLSRIIVFFTKQTLDQFPSLESSTLIYTFIDIIVDKLNKMGGSNKMIKKLSIC